MTGGAVVSGRPTSIPTMKTATAIAASAPETPSSATSGPGDERAGDDAHDRGRQHEAVGARRAPRVEHPREGGLGQHLADDHAAPASTRERRSPRSSVGHAWPERAGRARRAARATASVRRHSAGASSRLVTAAPTSHRLQRRRAAGRSRCSRPRPGGQEHQRDGQNRRPRCRGHRRRSAARPSARRAAPGRRCGCRRARWGGSASPGRQGRRPAACDRRNRRGREQEGDARSARSRRRGSQPAARVRRARGRRRPRPVRSRRAARWPAAARRRPPDEPSRSRRTAADAPAGSRRRRQDRGEHDR